MAARATDFPRQVHRPANMHLADVLAVAAEANILGLAWLDLGELHDLPLVRVDDVEAGRAMASLAAGLPCGPVSQGHRLEVRIAGKLSHTVEWQPWQIWLPRNCWPGGQCSSSNVHRTWRSGGHSTWAKETKGATRVTRTTEAVVAAMRAKPGPMPGEALLSQLPPCGHGSQSTGSVEFIVQDRLRQV